MQCERHPPRGERQTATAITVCLFLAVWMPGTPSFANDDPEVDLPKTGASGETGDGGWLRKLFKRQLKTVVQQETPKGSEEEGKNKPDDLAGKKSVKSSGVDKPKVGIGALGKKLAGFFVLEEDDAKPVDLGKGVVNGTGGRKHVAGSARIDKFVVTEDGTPLYEDGPLQTQPVDLKLDAGVIVSLVKWRRGWSDIRLETGEFGTIASDLLRKAKASDFPVEELAVKTPSADGDGQYVDADLPDHLPLLDSVELPDFSLIQGEEGTSDPLGVNPLLLPPIPE